MSPRVWTWDDPIDVLREVLDAGGVLAIPSESSYGLAVDPRDERGVQAIYAIKERDAGKALPVVAADVEQLVALGVARDAPELAVARALWPAALTVLFEIDAPLPATAGAATLAARIPAHARLRELLRRLGHALTATSANVSGRPPVLDPRELGPLLENHTAVIVDDGELPGGPPSTLVTWRAGKLHVLRPGAYAVDRLPRRLV